MNLKEVLMKRDGMSVEEADQAIEDAKQQVREGADPEDVLYEEFGLEPDYFFDLLG